MTFSNSTIVPTVPEASAGRSQKKRGALALLVMLGVLFLSALPGPDALWIVSLIAAGFVYARLGRPVRKRRAAFEAGRFMAIVFVVFTVFGWLAFGIALLVGGELPGFLDISTRNVVGILFLVALVFYFLLIVIVSAAQSAFGGFLAAAFRKEKPPAMPGQSAISPEPLDPADSWAKPNSPSAGVSDPRIRSSDPWA